MESKKILVGTVLATTAYSLYKIGNLTDKIPYERTYIISGVIGGAALAYSSALSGAFGGGSGNENGVILGGSIFVTTLGYSLSRGVFNQNPKNSLIAGLLLTAGTYIWYQSNKAENKKVKTSLGKNAEKEMTIIQQVPNQEKI